MFLKDWFTRGSDILETNAFEQTQKPVHNNSPEFYRIRISHIPLTGSKGYCDFQWLAG